MLFDEKLLIRMLLERFHEIVSFLIHQIGSMTIRLCAHKELTASTYLLTNTKT